MSFIATARPPEPATELYVDGDGWYPALSPDDIRATCRLDGTVTPARLQHATLAAVASVQAELAAWRAARELEGCASLAAVPAPQLNGESIKCHHYRRAVYACLQADLAEAYREIDTTPSAIGKTERVIDHLQARIGEHRRAMRWAISDLLGIRRTTVDLI
ncbi:head completion/stabilization protein [Ottowia sp. SB7-C50]|uniref:head completion/stabilization protein n=1 Tax=Ottowia sp. SB7-C50 TaxID=3081231 RepID=UPI0029541168|nr:head completion/stabilization protein [Ottowia sp. SB7-C50]WOP14654.1 head completion/stabilization protein [Ottowia sp. SB7-C50]